ncbi:MAG: transposase [Acutalibacteraceae bacterium]
MLKRILFAFMENGYVSTIEIEKLCNNDIRFIWILQDNPAQSHMTIDNFMKDYLVDCIDNIVVVNNSYIFKKENVDLSHIYIDGTKIRANANKYSWYGRKVVLSIDKIHLTRFPHCLRESIILSYIMTLNLKFEQNMQ